MYLGCVQLGCVLQYNKVADLVDAAVLLACCWFVCAFFKLVAVCCFLIGDFSRAAHTQADTNLDWASQSLRYFVNRNSHRKNNITSIVILTHFNCASLLHGRAINTTHNLLMTLVIFPSFNVPIFIC